VHCSARIKSEVEESLQFLHEHEIYFFQIALEMVVLLDFKEGMTYIFFKN
jgi:hypothetical protein